jgi:hypothetical protein
MATGVPSSDCHLVLPASLGSLTTTALLSQSAACASPFLAIVFQRSQHMYTLCLSACRDVRLSQMR